MLIPSIHKTFLVSHRSPLPAFYLILMEKHKTHTLMLLFLFYFQFSSLVCLSQLLSIVDEETGNASRIQTYIVHVQQPEGTNFLKGAELKKWHTSFLPNATLDSGDSRLVYSYRHSISGFAARMTRAEARTMETIDGFMHAQPDELLPLLTTYTPEFLGLSQRNGTWYDDGYGKGVIIGILDTGILPTHPSFSGDGMPPPPTKWRGSCDFRIAPCNNKVIGAAAFIGGRPSPVENDDDGHGSHVASIAAGNFVDEANVLGNAGGTAVGMAPKAHLAIYKVCTKDGCADSDILAGIDQAIHDRVDVLSISIGLGPRPFYKDSIAIGSFQAVRRRILTCAAAGNDGPSESTIANDAPWILTVGASSTDRRIRATLKLGNGTEIIGETAYQPSSSDSKMLPMAYPGYGGEGGSPGCLSNSFEGVNATGKIVLCSTGYNISNVEKGENVRKAGGAGMIVLNQDKQGFTTLSEAHVLPAVHVSYPDTLDIISYFDSSTNTTPTATISFNGTQFGHRPSPAVASFSSRGPSIVNGGILKPDIIGPGVNILAAWPNKVGPDSFRSPETTFNIQSGTSTATPHLAGIAALIKSSHRRFSPSAIKSAIMTSADRLDRDGKSPIADEHDGQNATLHAMGAGHVNPAAASDPGLVYHLHSHRYIHYLCGLGYTDEQIRMITQYRIHCSRIRNIGPERLNYPSISATLGFPAKKIVRRFVENVGEANSVYFLQVEQPEGVAVEVHPQRLRFSRKYERRWFHVVLKSSSSSTSLRKGQISQGQLIWVSKKSVVRSPISVTFN